MKLRTGGICTDGPRSKVESTLFFDDLLWNSWFRAVLLHEGNQAFEAYLRWFLALRDHGE